MAWKISEIDWKKMPENAEYFMLETDSDFLTWKLKDGSYMYYDGVEWNTEGKKWRERDNRKLHKVADHYVDESTQEKSWPVMGTECEFTYGGRSVRQSCVFVGQDETGSVVLKMDNDFKTFSNVDLIQFYRKRTPKEVWVEQAWKIFSDTADIQQALEDLYELKMNQK